MAQIILSRVGAAIGARAFPPALQSLGRRLGRSAGSFIGGRIDAALSGVTRRIEGPRLTDLHLQASEEGASIPAVFGRIRIAGQVIWAARVRETAETTTSGGGKSGRPRTSTTRYAYSLSFAVGLCAGEIAGVDRAWANGAPLDLSLVAHRIHTGGEDQAPDPLIEAIEGSGQAPAYRGLAYIVFEDLPLDAFGNAAPQLSFEVMAKPRDTGARLESLAQAVCLIPGSGEFAYATTPVQRVIDAGREAPENRHASGSRTNLEVSLDHLDRDLPNVAAVSLVTAWFGDDLRCGSCVIRPGVELAAKETSPVTWRAGGLDRAGARLVTQVSGAPAYGGTPSDQSLVEAIAALRARGKTVALNPFLLMDVAQGNALPDPYGAGAQAAYPWRGRITCMPAPGRSGSPDRSAAAKLQIDAFFGTVTPAQFASVNGAPVCTAPDWRYRQFILHHAHLAVLAGGVDIFIIGSELRGVTSVRDGPASYPAVAHLKALAADVRAVLGPATKIVYAADWSEYGGHRPAEGEVQFHLDPLWADPNIAAVAIDWYPPLADWRDGEGHADRTLARSIYDPAYLESRIEAGEDFDWYYASAADRAAQVRTPITDGAYGKPWIYRAKDVRRFWSELHFNRLGGLESSAPTEWLPKSKPVWFMELGVPAIDKGVNAPNLFVDDKSAESAIPPFSSGGRDDLIQRRALEAYLNYWAPSGANNPVSPLTGAPMIDMTKMFLWTWDARPFPHFPARRDVWADGGSWRRGHWLTGRAGAGTLGDVVSALCAWAGVDSADVSRLRGVVSGYVVDAPTTARAALEPLMAMHGFTYSESGGALVFRHLDDGDDVGIDTDDLAGEDAAPEISRADLAAAPRDARVRFIDGARDYRVATVSARQRDALGDGVAFVDAPAVLDEAQASALAERTLVEARAAAHAARLSVAPSRLDLEPGDRVTLEAFGAGARPFRIVSITDHGTRDLVLSGAAEGAPGGVAGAEPGVDAPLEPAPTPRLVVLDLPPLPGREDDPRPLAAVFAAPWRGPVRVFAGSDRERLTLRGEAAAPAGVGELLWALHPGPVGRWDDGNRVRIRMPGAALASVTEARLLEGANAFAVAGPDGAWEIIQARHAVLTGPDEYELSQLLRGQQGTETTAVAPVGAVIVRLDEALAPLDVAAHERGGDIIVTALPAGAPVGDPRAAEQLFRVGDTWARPFAPAHVRARRLPGGDVDLTWIRRGRRNGDAWQGEPDPEEGGEAWLVEILADGGVKRAFRPVESRQIYASGEQIADFGALPASLTVRVRQVSLRHGPGRGRDSILQL